MKQPCQSVNWRMTYDLSRFIGKGMIKAPSGFPYTSTLLRQAQQTAQWPHFDITSTGSANGSVTALRPYFDRLSNRLSDRRGRVLKNSNLLPENSTLILEFSTLILWNSTLILRNSTLILEFSTLILRISTLILRGHLDFHKRWKYWFFNT